jgi:hypothetical protein
MSIPIVEQLNMNSVLVKQKYFDISILTIPVLALLIPDMQNKILFGILFTSIAIISYTVFKREISITKDIKIEIKISLNIGRFNIMNSHHIIDRQFFNVTIDGFTSGGSSESTGSLSYTILLLDKEDIVARINGFSSHKNAEDVAQKIRS